MKRAIFFIFWSFLTLLIVTIPDATGSATATPTTAETPTAAITAIDPLTGTPERRITFGGNSGYQPFEWEDQGMPLGFNIDLAKAVSKAGDIPAEFKLGNWAEILEAFEQGEVDVLAMYVSDERARLFRFSTPFYVVNHAIYGAPTQLPIPQPVDFTGQRVAVETRSYAHEELLAKKFNVELVLTDSTEGALNAVLLGEADYAILTESVAENLIADSELPLESLSPPFWPRNYAFAVQFERKDLYAWLEGALSQTIASDQYQAVYEKWESEIRPGRDSYIQVPFYVGYTALAAIALTVIFFLTSWTLRLRVISKSFDLGTAMERADRSENNAQHIADYETETGLCRPHYFAEMVDKTLKQKPASCELMIFKLVHLSEVRGTLGQAYSSELIKHITMLLKDQITGPSCYFGRGIFAVFSDPSEIELFFESLSTKQIEAMPYAQYVAGSACFPEHGSACGVLLDHADAALSMAVYRNKHRLVYDSSMDPSTTDQAVVTAFRTHSLKGMYAVFQPQIDIKTGQLIGAEALVRWQHPTLGALTPDEFVPLVEKLGYISQITKLMLNEAIRVSALLRKQNRPLVTSVNVSVHDLADPNFFETIKSAVEHFKGEFCDLKLELTETSFSSEIGHISDTLVRLNELGIKVSIDDFGTGYSSLAYLSAFPIQELKIDRAFVTGMVEHEKNCNIIRATLVLADHLKLKTVAEGVEDEKTLTLLDELGCSVAQGYFISKPLPEAEFLKFIDNYLA
ncbi:putative bifunctional diguanylate cyclase/phosphodiesterase [Pseudidiomarina halophila]